MTKKQDYKKKVKEEIHVWENEGPGFLTNVADFVFWPAQKAAELLTPEYVKETVSKAVEGCLNGLLWGADYLFADKAVIAKVAEKNKELDSLNKISNSDDLESMDAAADYYWNQQQQF